MLMIIEMVEIEGLVVMVVAVTTQLETSFPSPVVSQPSAQPSLADQTRCTATCEEQRVSCRSSSPPH